MADQAEVVQEEGAGDEAVPHSKRLPRRDSLDLEANRINGWSPHLHKGLSTAVILRLAYQSVGVVYGDVGTSPLYTYATTFPNGLGNLPRDKENLLGVASLIIYSLAIIPLFKYVFLVLSANDNGEGGTLALYTLLCRYVKVGLMGNQSYEDQQLSNYKLPSLSRKDTSPLAAWLKEKFENSPFLKHLLFVVVLVATSLVIGDGTLTPSISVLSAISGLQVNKATNVSQGVVVGVTVVILLLLFLLQHKGTDRVGFLFAPAVCVWFVANASFGIYNIAKHDPSVFKAFNPQYIYYYFRNNKKDGWIHLGGIVLAITGTEAMFADLGHFSAPSIRIAFAGFVFPSLLLTYLGQAAYLMAHPEHVDKTFYKSIPSPFYWPMFAVATAAAIIASQAMISAVFSILKQSMALDCFPRVTVVHTSKKFPGQIYIPEINWLLMILCIVITVGFGNTASIGNAYGIAVVGVMLITTCLLTLIMLVIWQVSLPVALLFLTTIGSVETIYLSAVLYKVPQGGWVPLVYAVVFLAIMYTWQYVQLHKYQYEMEHKISLEWLLGLGDTLGCTRLPGISLVYTELAQGVPAIFSHLISNLPAIHSVIVFVCIRRLPLPHVPDDERFLVRRVGPKDFRMFRCVVRYGYGDNAQQDHLHFQTDLLNSLSHFMHMETDAQAEQSGVAEEVAFLAQAKEAGVTYLLGSVDLRAKPGCWLRSFIIDKVFAFMRRNSRDSSDVLNVPHTRLLLVGMLNEI